MKFVNNTDKRIKVMKENTNPAEYQTVYKGQTIEAESFIFQKYYLKEGLVVYEAPIKEVPKEKPKEKTKEKTKDVISFKSKRKKK